ncbi:MAG: biosynthetic peptidoglycan transglycosylase, partial [Bacteroidota bacterium]|nr:biosynthetic peptidoglycan transglycosylase [Bacteroidota bacterium]
MIKKISEDKYVRWIWYIFWIPLLSILLLMLILSTGLFGFMPSFEELENPKSNLATEIYSSDQVLLGTYYIQNRSNIHYSDLSPNVTNALIATEDARFEKHSGVDLRSMFRVMTKNLLWGNRNAGGGSTITQQLAKNLFPRDNNPNVFELVFIKLKEWITAIKLERNYTKQEILAMYLNTVDFGSQAYGIRLASRTYYGKEPKNLTVDEAAMLIGLLKAPTYYSPVRHPERALKRREVVLYQMKRYHYLTDEEYEKYSKIPFDRKKYRVQDQNVGL